ncbi:MAG: hypothetical protein Terrestrivirus2_177 [Terrestrivirus sp.]|uniref:Uncharacterized protein n=1 Tax=Terrestrivirus sp. TaxID=2487775 RepID=A0A3G4ZQF0_9VIRU|nr:MAG: hypothetical protein Terrestrivirus2_177 [Terrestrivirus sp.]
MYKLLSKQMKEIEENIKKHLQQIEENNKKMLNKLLL